MSENILLLTLSFTGIAAIAWIFQFLMKPRSKVQLTVEQTEELRKLEEQIKNENSKDRSKRSLEGL